jgi:hypothetical protein
MPKKSGTAVQVQKGVTAPSSAAMTFPGKPGQRSKTRLKLLKETVCLT